MDHQEHWLPVSILAHHHQRVTSHGGVGDRRQPDLFAAHSSSNREI
jgi:hypothetical protein